MLPDGYLTGVLYRGILQNTLVPFARHYFGDNYRYQDDNSEYDGVDDCCSSGCSGNNNGAGGDVYDAAATDDDDRNDE